MNKLEREWSFLFLSQFTPTELLPKLGGCIMRPPHWQLKPPTAGPG